MYLNIGYKNIWHVSQHNLHPLSDLLAIRFRLINPSSGPYARQTAGIMEGHVDIWNFRFVLFCWIRHHIYNDDKIVIVEDILMSLKIIKTIFCDI